jgi:hypothetical protein
MATIKERKAQIQALIDRQLHGVLFNDTDVAQFNALTGWSFLFYKRIVNPSFPNDPRCIANSEDGETFRVWSWNRALTPDDSLMRALRIAVADQMAEYKGTATRVCVACGTTALITVDHKKLPFKKIALAFCAEQGTVELTNDATGAGWFIKSSQVQDAWQAFHKRHADYQILCRSCNSKKGTKHDTD